VANYEKGARSERELIHMLEGKGFSVVRAAGSGVAGGCPDLLAFKGPRQFAIECKAWGGERVAVDHAHYASLKRWEENTGITTMVAWRMDRASWLFIYLPELEENPQSYSITRRRAEEIGRTFSDAVR